MNCDTPRMKFSKNRIVAFGNENLSSGDSKNNCLYKLLDINSITNDDVNFAILLKQKH